MKLRNFWLAKIREKMLLKVVVWARRNNIQPEQLTDTDIIEALLSQARNVE